MSHQKPVVLALNTERQQPAEAGPTEAGGPGRAEPGKSQDPAGPGENSGRDSSQNLLGITCEVTSRLQKFTEFWRDNPVLARFELQEESRRILGYSHRVSRCKRAKIALENPVIGWRGFSQNGKTTASYSNLQTCGNVWLCPVCAAKITARRLEELQTAVAQWQAAGNEVFLATFTLQHLAADSCASVLEALNNAHQRFWGNRAGRNLAEDFKVRGKVRGLEVTYTANGWHWHHHVMLFIEGLLPPNEQSNLEGDAGRAWANEVAASGAFADSVHGFDLRRADSDISEYFTKHGHLPKKPAWGIANEIASTPTKKAAAGGITPFELLAASGLGVESAGRLFAEYALSVKGKSYLKWSKGLRAMLGLGAEKTDQEIAEELREPAVKYVHLESDTWKFIERNRLRGKILKWIAAGDWSAILNALDDPDLPPVYFPGLFIAPECPICGE